MKIIDNTGGGNFTTGLGWVFSVVIALQKYRGGGMT